MRSAPRFAGVDRGAGHYESYFIKATRPGGGQGIWIRHTVHKRPDDDPMAALWLTVFDAEAPGPRAAKASFEAAELSAPQGSYIRIDGASSTPAMPPARSRPPSVKASWDLRFTDQGEPFHHLPYDRLYDAPLPRTKFLSPYPSARFDGRLTVDGDDSRSPSGPG